LQQECNHRLSLRHRGHCDRHLHVHGPYWTLLLVRCRMWVKKRKHVYCHSVRRSQPASWRHSEYISVDQYFHSLPWPQGDWRGGFKIPLYACVCVWFFLWTSLFTMSNNQRLWHPQRCAPWTSISSKANSQFTISSPWTVTNNRLILIALCLQRVIYLYRVLESIYSFYNLGFWIKTFNGWNKL
jgi:hypothetical protein